MTDDPSSQGQTRLELRCGRDDGVGPSKTFVFISRLDAGKHLESIRSVSQRDSWPLGSNRALRWLLPRRRNGAGRPAPAGGLGAILAKHPPSTGLVLVGFPPFR